MSHAHHLLIVDDEEAILFSLKRLMEGHGYQVSCASDGASAIQILKGKKRGMRPVDAMILDVRLPDCLGTDLLREAKQLRPELVILMITGHGNVPEAVSSLQAGASDYLLKPFSVDEIVIRLQRAFQGAAMSSPYLAAPAKLPEETSWAVGPNSSMKELLTQVHRAAKSPATTVLICGETGTGKELVARRLHALSGRAAKPFVEINAAALSRELLESELFGHEAGAFTGATKTKKGLFEAAHGGTLFLDEIGDMELSIQAKLLRALQERKVRRVGALDHIDVDVRLIAATNKDLSLEVREGRFREDLFYRLNVVSLKIPPLRERLDDLDVLVQHWVQRLSHELGLEQKTVDPEAIQRLKQHPWPGNIRELRNCLERVLLLECSGDRVCPEHLAFLPPKDSHSSSL
jgi:DNA-binding NtrC family response regulator